MKVALSLLLLSGFVVNAGVEVWGTLEYRRYPANGGMQMLARRAFHVQVDGCRWTIISTNIHPTIVEPFTFVRVANDDENIYTTRAYDPLKVPGAFENPNSKFVTNSVTINHAGEQGEDPEFSFPIWFGYASACHLSKKTNGRMANFLLSSTIARVDLRPFTIQWESNCLRQMLFHNEGRFPERGTGQLRFKPAKPPFEKGFVEWKFDVTEMATVGTNCVPKRFVISYFTTKPSARDAEDTRKVAEIEVVASRHILTDTVLPSPTLLDGFSAVYDERVRDKIGRPTEYLTADSVFPTNSTRFRNAQNRSGVNAPHVPRVGAEQGPQ